MCNWLTTVRSRNEVPLSPCACTDCWGCALEHGVKTVRPLDGAAFFPCYSISAARNLLATDVCHTVARSAVTNNPTTLWSLGTLSYYDQLRGKQQGLGTKLPHTKTNGLPGCTCA